MTDRPIAASVLAMAVILLAEAIGFVLAAAPAVGAGLGMVAIAAAAGSLLHRWHVRAVAAAAARGAEADRARLMEEDRERQRQMRHDVRGALSPALLMADRLLGNKDPVVHRAGEIVVKSVERTAALLNEPPTPPAGP